ncbi:MAG: virulence factor TspB C-terminal domain-related protein [Methylobacter sp.]
MDNVYRSLILLLFLFFSTGSVFADSYPATSVTTYYIGSTAFSTLSSACDSLAWSAETSVADSGSCLITRLSDGYKYRSYPTGSTVYSCPAGGTVSGSSCIYADTCIAPNVRDATGVCGPPPVSCTYTEYNDTSSTCAKIPNCYALGTGDYFDIPTKSCANSTPNKVCISGTKHRHYCQPVDDCVLDATICSTNPDFLLMAENDKAIALSTARVKVIEDMLAINAGVDYAKGQAEAKDAKLAADKAGMADSVTAYTNPQATQEQQAQAKLDYAEWVKRELEDKAKARNAWEAADAAAAAKKRAQIPADHAPTTTMPGDAESDSEITSRERDIVITGVRDSDTGTGNGTGPGTGTQAGLPSPTDNTISAIAGLKGAIDGVKGSVDGVKDAINNKKTDCQLTPNAAGCSTLDSPGVPEALLTDEVGISSGHASWGAGTCPSSVSVSHGVAFDYQPMCSQLVFFKPILIAAGLIISLFIVSGGVKD